MRQGKCKEKHQENGQLLRKIWKVRKMVKQGGRERIAIPHFSLFKGDSKTQCCEKTLKMSFRSIHFNHLPVLTLFSGLLT